MNNIFFCITNNNFMNRIYCKNVYKENNFYSLTKTKRYERKV